MMTINISLPKKMYEDAKGALASRRYASISELMRDALRKLLYGDVTENEFTREFEDLVLKAAKEPRRKDQVWETEEDIDTYFDALHKSLEKKRHAKS